MGMKERIYEETNSGKIIPKGELVRCKDCKHWSDGCCYSNESNRINFTVEVPDDWFCADGKPKEGR